ncbi:MAG: outer membrane beta-barrel protein [Bacteroidales bacterium]|nr:outer membrane beta-barrel protein [Bacteroidales bacterium]
MKKIFTILLLALFVQVSFAQEEETKEKRGSDINTIFSEENLKFTGGFIGPEFKVSDTYDDYGLLIGGRIGAIINDNFLIGIGGYGLTTKSTFPMNNDIYRISMGYGGLAMEYTLFRKKAIHFSIPVMVGAGGYSFYEDDSNDFWNNYNEIDNSAAFIVEPGVNIELNLAKFIKFSVGASYRLVYGTNFDVVDITNEELSDLSFNASFKFGLF